MKNVTLSADEDLIEAAREVARSQNVSLNQLFRDWLRSIAKTEDRIKRMNSALARMDQFNSGGSFSRDESNER